LRAHERIFLGDTVTYEVTTHDGQNIVIRELLTRRVGLSHGPGTDAFMHIAPNQYPRTRSWVARSRYPAFAISRSSCRGDDA
jgi:hypothetical protein